VIGKPPESKQYPPELDEVFPDAWDRFERAVHIMAKAGPQHRIGSAAVKSGLKERLAKRVAREPKRTVAKPSK